MTIAEFVKKFKLRLPEKYWGKIVVLDEISGQYCYSEPLEHEEYSGYFYVPEFEDHIVSRDAVVLDLKRNRIKTWSIWRDPKKIKKGGYRTTSAVDNQGRKRRFTRHRAMASAFITYELRDATMLVNHINGIPGDDRVENLEWVTYAENNKHAYDAGLYKDGKTNPIVYRNRLTGETKAYATVKACAEDLGFSYGMVNERFRNPELMFDDGHDFKKDDGDPWPSDRKYVKAPTVRTVCCRDIETGTITIFEGSKRASEKLGISRATIDAHCTSEVITPTGGYNFRFMETGMTFPIHSELSLMYFKAFPKNAKGLVYILTDKYTGEVKYCLSIAELCLFLDVSVGKAQLLIQKRQSHPNYNFSTHDPKTGYTTLTVMPL